MHRTPAVDINEGLEEVIEEEVREGYMRKNRTCRQRTKIYKTMSTIRMRTN